MDKKVDRTFTASHLLYVAKQARLRKAGGGR